MAEETNIVNVVPATRKRQMQHAGAAFIGLAGMLIEALQKVWPDLIRYYPKLAAVGPFVTMAGFAYLWYLRQHETGKVQPVDLSPTGARKMAEQDAQDKPNA